MSELKYYKLFHRASALTSPEFLSVVEFGNNDEVYLKSEADKVIRHHKYKRCLAMAKWCGYFADYWECCEPPDCGAFIARAKFHRKWHKRWLELAEKFKEAK